MKDETIFTKTLAGEEAIRERTRLVQRNLRTVLILVDGVADVATLKRKIGDPTTVDSALAELQKMGLAAASNSPPEPETASQPADLEIADFTPPEDASGSEAAFVGDHGPMSVALEEGGPNSRHLEAQEEELYEHAYGQEDHTQMALLPEAVEKPAQTRTKSRARIKARQWIAIAVIGAAVLAVLRMFLYPYDEYRPQFEQGLSRVLGEKVSIGGVRVSFVPLPIIVLEKVSVGDTPYATIDALRLAPEPGSLLAGDYRYREALIDGIRIRDAGLARVSGWLNPAGKGDAHIQKIAIERLGLDLGSRSIGNLSGSIDLDPKGGIGRVALRANEGDLRLEARPHAAGVSLAASGNNWRLPSREPLVLQAVTMKGELSAGRLAIESLEGRAYDGSFVGGGVIAWGRNSSMNLQLELTNVVTSQLITALGAPPLVEGKASAQVALSAEAQALGRLEDNLRAKGSFKVVRGKLRHIDLPEALRASAQTRAQVVRGGDTAFEEFTGKLATDGAGIHVSEARIASGLFRASGQATISRLDRKISGSASVALTGSAGGRRAVILLTGDAANPELKAARQ